MSMDNFSFGEAKIIVLSDKHSDKGGETLHTANVRIKGHVKDIHLDKELIDLASLNSGYNPLGLEIYDKEAELLDDLGFYQLSWKTRVKS